MPDDAEPAGFLGFEHVQLIIPDGKERRAREFYVDVLGFIEIVRPESLGGRGGGWFRNGAVHLHLGSERDFHPTEKGHPAWLVPDLSALVTRCESAGHPIEIAVPLPGFERVHVYDPFGNRLELMERTAVSKTASTPPSNCSETPPRSARCPPSAGSGTS